MITTTITIMITNTITGMIASAIGKPDDSAGGIGVGDGEGRLASVSQEILK